MSDIRLKESTTYFPSGAIQSCYRKVEGSEFWIKQFWYENGSLLSEIGYLDGVPHGIIREWSALGFLTLCADMKHGEFDGNYQSWWSDGVLKEQGQFKQGRRQPGYRWFKTDGTLWREE